MIDYSQDPHVWNWGPYFTVDEFKCKGTGKCLMAITFMDRLVRLRTNFGRPMVVTSGYRAPEYNKTVSDTGDNGPHTTGHAADIAVEHGAAYDLLHMALNLGFTGIGVKQKGEGRFLHLDDLSDGYPRPNVWSY